MNVFSQFRFSTVGKAMSNTVSHAIDDRWKRFQQSSGIEKQDILTKTALAMSLVPRNNKVAPLVIPAVGAAALFYLTSEKQKDLVSTANEEVERRKRSRELGDLPKFQADSIKSSPTAPLPSFWRLCYTAVTREEADRKEKEKLAVRLHKLPGKEKEVPKKEKKGLPGGNADYRNHEEWNLMEGAPPKSDDALVMEELQEKMRVLEDRIAELKCKEDNLIQELEGEKQNHRATQSKLQAESEKKEALEKSVVADISQVLSHLKTGNRQGESKPLVDCLQRVEQKLSDLTDSVQGLGKKLKPKESSSEPNLPKEEREKYEAEHAALEIKSAHSASELIKLKKEFDKYKEEAEGEIGYLNSLIVEKNKRAVSQENEIQRLKKLEETNKQLEKDLKMVLLDHANLEAEKEKLEKENQKLETKVTRMTDGINKIFKYACCMQDDNGLRNAFNTAFPKLKDYQQQENEPLSCDDLLD